MEQSKKSQTVLICVVLTIFFSPHTIWAQEDYDTYQPMRYAPLRYIPKSTGGPLKIQPYQTEQVDPTVRNLRSFYALTRKTPGASDDYCGDISAYEKLADISYAYSETKNIGKKKQMKYFQDDWNTLHHYIFKKDSLKRAVEKELCVLDSISTRQKFVKDSIHAREIFYRDSINLREEFVEDSLYRVDYRKTHKYDYVVFDGPHGKPVLCYRKGKIIEGTVYKDGKRAEEWKNGKKVFSRVWFSEHWEEYCRLTKYNEGYRDPLPYAYTANTIISYKRNYPELITLAKEYGVDIKEVSPYELFEKISHRLYEVGASSFWLFYCRDSHNWEKNYVIGSNNPILRWKDYDHISTSLFPANHPLYKYASSIDTLQCGFLRDCSLKVEHIEKQLLEDINLILAKKGETAINYRMNYSAAAESPDFKLLRNDGSVMVSASSTEYVRYYYPRSDKEINHYEIWSCKHGEWCKDSSYIRYVNGTGCSMFYYANGKLERTEEQKNGTKTVIKYDMDGKIISKRYYEATSTWF